MLESGFFTVKEERGYVRFLNSFNPSIFVTYWKPDSIRVAASLTLAAVSARHSQNVLIDWQHLGVGMNGTIGFCGIDCSKCELGNETISKNAEALKNKVENYGISQWYQLVPVADNEKFSFGELNKGLAWLANYAACPECYNGGGPPECPVRLCAKEKKFENCSMCENIDNCKKMDFLEPGHPNLRENLKKMKKK